MEKKIKIGLIYLLLSSILVPLPTVFAACVNSVEIIDNFVSFNKSPVEMYYDGYFVLENVGNTSHLIKVEFKNLASNTTIDVTNSSNCHYVCDDCGHGYYPEDICKSPLILHPDKKISFRNFAGTYKIYVDGVLTKKIDFHKKLFECGRLDITKFWFYENSSCPSGVCDINPVGLKEELEGHDSGINIELAFVFLIILFPFLIVGGILRRKIKHKYIVLLVTIGLIFAIFVSFYLFLFH